MNEAVQNLIDVDRIIHEPARLMIMIVLATVKEADFLFLQNNTKLTKGNLSSHLSKLEEAGYVAIEKTFVGKMPRTICHLTPAGQKALADYRQQIKSVVD